MPGNVQSPLQGENGFLCPVQNIDAVEQVMAFYLKNPAAILQHGQNSRKLAAEVFDVRIVNDIILRAMNLKGASDSVEDRAAVPAAFGVPQSSF